MPSSYQHVIPIICQIIEKRQDKRVLDIGFGRGKYGLLTREYDHALERLDGVEGTKDYITDIQRAIYDLMFEVDIRTSFNIMTFEYDCVYLIDVIEHMSKDEAYNVMNHFLKYGSAIIVSTPLEDIPQHDELHPLENHVSHWDEPDFHEYNYERHLDPTGKALIMVINP